MADDSTFSITNKTKGTLPRVPFVDMKNAVLGKNYELSLVFLGERRSRTLNRTYRNKNKPANVLSFPLSSGAGEMFITPHIAKKQAAEYGMTARQFIAKLFIHGLLHLKGLPHGATMDKLEHTYLTRFKII